MRIVIITGLFPPDIGGPATNAKFLQDELLSRGFEVEVVSFSVSRSKHFLFRHAHFLIQILKRVKSGDVLFSQDTVSVGLPSAIAAKILKVKYVLRVPGDFAWEQSVQKIGIKDDISTFQEKRYLSLRVILYKMIQRFVTSSSDAVIVPSYYFKSIVDKWVDDPNKVRVVYNGMAEIDDYGSEKEDNLIVTSGRLVPWKGFEELILLVADTPSYKLEIIGDGPDYNKLQKLIDFNGLGERVTLLGAVNREVLLNKLASAQVFVLNTEFESFSYQVLEAMSVGVPVVVTKVGSLPELITDQLEGRLYDLHDTSSLREILLKLNDDVSFWKSATNRAVLKAKQFSISKTVDGYLEVINSLH